MRWLREKRLWFLLLVLAQWAPVRAVAQDDPNETPLGDVARNLRKQTPTRPVIDDDNLPQVMKQAESRQGAGSSLRFLMGGDSKGFLVSAPDATCSLSFSANAKFLLSSQYAEMELPPRDAAKLESHATIEGDALTVSVRNETDWHVSEVAVALTVIKKNSPTDIAGSLAAQNPAAELQSAELQVRPEKKPDTTMIYRMRAAALPGETTGFSAPLDLEVAPGDEWHWALVQARGYPPQSYNAKRTQETGAAAKVVPVTAIEPSNSTSANSAGQDPQR
jgi:hypothetical protein